jgi:DNA-binding beta-propeller fold protein YncE
MMKYTYLFIGVLIATLGGLYMALFLIGAIVGSERVWQIGGAVVFLTFLLLWRPGYAAFQRRINREKKVVVEVGGDGLTVHTRPGDVFTFGDAQLGRWTLAGYGGVTKGTALHLRSGPHRFVLGGRDHRIAAGTPLEATPVDAVDAWVWAPEFDELLTIVGRPEPPPGEPTHCLLTPNPARLFSSSSWGMFKNNTRALALNANPPQPSLAIDVSGDAISVIDVESNARLASASPSRVTATAAESTRKMRYVGALTTPVLVVRVPNSETLTIGCPDMNGPPQTTWSGRTKLNYRFSWRGEVPAEDEPEYVVSDADWLTLIEALGLASDLEDKAQAECDGDAQGLTAATQAPLARPTRRLWIPVVVFAVIMFVALPAMMLVAMSASDRRQSRSDQLAADKARQFALPFTDLRLPHGVAVDAGGNVYVAETRTNQVFKLAAGSNTQTVLPFTGLDLFDDGVINTFTASVAVDTGGNVYVTDSGHNRVVKLAAGSNTQAVLPFRGLDDPDGVAVDTAGTVYVVDYSHGRVLKLAAGSTTPTLLPKTGRLGGPSGEVAVDRSGNVYISATTRAGSYLLRLAPGSDTWTKLPSAGNEHGVAVDPAGNLYVLTSGDAGGVKMLAPGSNSWTALPRPYRFLDPMGLAVDARRNVYVTDHTGYRAPGGGSFFGVWHPKDDAQGFVIKLLAG